MTYLTGAGILNDAVSIITDNSTSTRAKMLVWLNVVAQKLAVVRPWMFLNNGSASLTPVNNVITLPADYGQFQSIAAGTVFFFDCRNQLTPGEAWAMDQSTIGATAPRGYTEGVSAITLHGAAYTGAVTLTYTIEPPAITDTATATAWPAKFRPMFMRAILDYFFEYDMDERSAISYQLSAAELSELKKWDNSMKPRTQRNRHGYRGTR